MDSLDYVEAIFCLEEVFEVEVPEKYSEGFESHREIVDWLEPSLSNTRPNERAKAFLRRLATAQHRPELIEELNGCWNRIQITAIVEEVFPSEVPAKKTER
jgi:hypothetical protein